ncbi:folate-binding protein YgfZ [Erythrobacter insulae]|uniref:Folate-binding protein YgfZ n=1 Tax=Erythrobacter insulae TaxID=2584124 RepID=A0A547P8Q2_9SPHN|nr:folate-binding protein YgfZ [Erythrobacter insulae]TRD10525.1 folate-binding protein YgfZ [Erythrobacter insulae]
MTARILSDRAVIRLAPTDTGEDVRGFLQGLVTNDVSGRLPVYAALLSAQGKTMFEFLVFENTQDEGGGVLIDCEAQSADDLAKRLSLYRLRRKIAIARDATVAVYWNTDRFEDAAVDPRHAGLGYRTIAPMRAADTADDAYRSLRLSLGIPEGRGELSDILWLETNAVELNGVSFEKGCYIGQENTARMNWRQKVNRRLVVVPSDQSDEKRRKAIYPELGMAVDHLRVSDLDPASLPEWQSAGLSG